MSYLDKIQYSTISRYSAPTGLCKSTSLSMCRTVKCVSVRESQLPGTDVNSKNGSLFSAQADTAPPLLFLSSRTVQFHTNVKQSKVVVDISLVLSSLGLCKKKFGTLALLRGDAYSSRSMPSAHGVPLLLCFSASLVGCWTKIIINVGLSRSWWLFLCLCGVCKQFTRRD